MACIPGSKYVTDTEGTYFIATTYVHLSRARVINTLYKNKNNITHQSVQCYRAVVMSIISNALRRPFPIKKRVS
jgi:hypothetical protein